MIADSISEQPRESSLRKPDRVIHVGRNNLMPGSIDDRTKDFQFPDGFDIDSLIVIGSPIQKLGREGEVDRLSTEKRAAGKFIKEGFQSTEGENFHDVLVKGLGGDGGDDLMLVEGPVVRSAEIVENPHRSDRPTKRFETSKTNVRGIFGVVEFPEGQLSDTNEILRRAGLRTRRLILSGAYGEKVLFGTREGVFKRGELPRASEKNLMPHIEIWGMRSRYRSRDLIEISTKNKGHYVSAARDNPWKSFGDIPAEKFEKKVRQVVEEKLPVETRKLITDQYTELAGEILIRCEGDEDERFSELYKTYKDQDLENPEILKEFYAEYIKVFSSVLGEQVGIMFREGAFTRERQLNTQNVTLLGEIVDHDVTFIDAGLKEDDEKVVSQVDQTYFNLNDMLAALFAGGVLPESFDPMEALVNYKDGLLSKLSNEDREKVVTAFKKQTAEYLTNAPVDQSSHPFKVLEDSISTLQLQIGSAKEKNNNPQDSFVLYLEELLKKRKEKFETNKGKFVWDPTRKNPVKQEDGTYVDKRTGKWVLKGDIIGTAKDIMFLELFSGLNSEN